MQCPKCQTDNPEGKKFCRECGSDLILACPKCSSEILPSDKFCGVCRYDLRASPSAVPDKPTDQKPPEVKKTLSSSESARKYVTVLFSDMSGYTTMTEKLDPEETKEIMGKVFGEISKVIAKYEGFIEKFIGDAVMALFGVPQSHEDDPVRAIKAAREIHDIVSSISHQYEKRIGKPLAMHTGICTGLVVTGDVNLEKGTHGVLGDTINTAARLSGFAKPGEIVVGHDTYHQAEGYFTFEALEPTTIKGKAEPVRPYKVLSVKEDPTKTHRLSGLRAELIGRKVEMAQLQEAVTNLKQGKGSIFSIVGDAGTGKSRLIEDFKASLNLDEVQWREGHAYAYAQNIPYFPLMDLFSRAWQIQEGDPPDQLRQKVETGSGHLLGERKDLIPYLGSLYSIKYPEIENVGPEYWKARLHDAVQLILANLCIRAPAIICIEDLHWADPSSVELLRNILSDFRHPVIFLCIYRPPFSLFTGHQAKAIRSYQEIRLQDLSTSDAQNMMESLLQTDTVPVDLKRFIRDKVEGNPFYLEEVINSLLETGTLIKQEEGSWLLTKPIAEANIPSTVQGVISARLDRLESESKRILQEASVIGRAFFYEILRRITELKDQIDKSLIGLERLDLIRTRALQPDLEYIFKHALAQEAVYNGLLKKERQRIHHKIGEVMEDLFNDRLPEFYETLAYHFKQGLLSQKATHYIMKAAQKSFDRYSLDESHLHYRDAYEITISGALDSQESKKLLIDLLVEWAVVFHHRGDYSGLYNLFKGHEPLASSIDDKSRAGMFYMWLGGAMERQELYEESYNILLRSLALGKEVYDDRVIGYTSAWLTRASTNLGLLDEALIHANRVQSLALYHMETELFRQATGALSYAHRFRGEAKKAYEAGKRLEEYGRDHSASHCVAQGYMFQAYGRYTAGDFPAAIELSQLCMALAKEPMFVVTTKTTLGMAYLANRQIKEAEETILDVIQFSDEFGYKLIGTIASAYLGIIKIMKGNLLEGIPMFEKVMQHYKQANVPTLYVTCKYTLGRIYSQIAQSEKGKNMPSAIQIAEEYLCETIETAKAINSKGVLAQASSEIGCLRRYQGRIDEARKYFSDAIRLFEECEADVYLEQARNALAKLN